MQDKRVAVPTWSHQLIVSVLSLDCSLTSALTVLLLAELFVPSTTPAST